MFEPQKETEPTIAANSEKTATYVGSAGWVTDTWATPVPSSCTTV